MFMKSLGKCILDYSCPKLKTNSCKGARYLAEPEVETSDSRVSHMVSSFGCEGLGPIGGGSLQDVQHKALRLVNVKITKSLVLILVRRYFLG